MADNDDPSRSRAEPFLRSLSHQFDYFSICARKEKTPRVSGLSAQKRSIASNCCECDVGKRPRSLELKAAVVRCLEKLDELGHKMMFFLERTFHSFATKDTVIGIPPLLL